MISSTGTKMDTSRRKSWDFSSWGNGLIPMLRANPDRGYRSFGWWDSRRMVKRFLMSFQVSGCKTPLQVDIIHELGSLLESNSIRVSWNDRLSTNIWVISWFNISHTYPNFWTIISLLVLALLKVSLSPVIGRPVQDLFGIGCDLSAEAVRLLCSKVPVLFPEGGSQSWWETDRGNHLKKGYKWGNYGDILD